MIRYAKNLFVAEDLSNWEEPEVLEWKEKSAKYLKTIYLDYAGKQWDKYCLDYEEDLKLLRAKICYACFGDPQKENVHKIWDDQQKSAQEIVDLIVDALKKHLNGPWLYLSIIFMCAKQKETEFVSPIFSVCTSENVVTASRIYIDLQRQTYSSWEDWKKNNTLPMLKYACPRFGYFTCSEVGKYEFDRDKDPQIEFGTTPGSNKSLNIFSHVKDLFVAEHKSSWEEPEVLKWKEESAKFLKTIYLNYAGKQWDKYCLDNDEDLKLLRAKICYACFGSPQKDDVHEIWDAYSEDQQKSAQEIVDLIVDAHKKHRNDPWLHVSIIFMCAKQKETEFVSPIFSVCTSENVANETANRVYIDLQRRTYNGWKDWIENNTLPMLKYACPRFGYFTCSEVGEYEFDRDKDPQIEFGTTPACNFGSRVSGILDWGTGITGLVSGLVLAATLVTPLGPITVGSAAAAGTCASVYGTGRSVTRLKDKKQHGENLWDWESLTIYLNLIAAPLALGQGVVNANLARGAVQGRIFSQSYRTFATILNFSRVGIDGLLVTCGLVNLVEKSKNDSLTPFDVMQFSMSVFFFTNTLIQPKTATAIIRKAQQTYMGSYAENLTDQGAKDAFDKFLQSNKESGSIKDTSKIIRCINRMNDPDKFFSRNVDAQKIQIGGRKGRTVLVTNENGQTTRIYSSGSPLGHSRHAATPVTQLRPTSKANNNMDNARAEKNAGPEYARQKQQEYAEEYYSKMRKKAAKNLNNAWNLYRQRKEGTEEEDIERKDGTEEEDIFREEENPRPETFQTEQSIGQDQIRINQDYTTVTPRIEVLLGEFADSFDQDCNSTTEENEESSVLIKINSGARIVGIMFDKGGYFKIYVSQMTDNVDWSIELIRESFKKWALQKFQAVIPIFIFVETNEEEGGCEDNEESTSDPDEAEDQA